MQRFLLILFVIISSTILFFGCSSIQSCNIKIDEIGNYPQPLFEPLRLKVGAYYRDEFRTFDIIQQFKKVGVDQTKICKMQLGKANIALFNYILFNVFEKVTAIQNLRKGPDHIKDIDLIVEPAVYSYTYERSSAKFDYIHITYTINVYSPKGEQIDYWRIEGSGHMPKISSIKPSHVLELTQMAMREVAAKFMTDVCKRGEIKKLLYNQCNQ
jgi:hypothetical protein